ncbi:calcium-dependent secretion activator 1 isoform X1 [Tachysurus ichikawai]
MLDPSSSEEEDEVVEEERKTATVAAPKPAGNARVSSNSSRQGASGIQPSRGGQARPSSPGPAAREDKEKDDVEKMQREEEERKKRLQVYVFVMRCIAYPFNAKQPTDMARRQQKVRNGEKVKGHIATDCSG